MSMMFFYFLKIIFDISTSKRFKKYKPHSILAKKKKIKIHSKAGSTGSQSSWTAATKANENLFCLSSKLIFLRTYPL